MPSGKSNKVGMGFSKWVNNSGPPIRRPKEVRYRPKQNRAIENETRLTKSMMKTSIDVMHVNENIETKGEMLKKNSDDQTTSKSKPSSSDNLQTTKGTSPSKPTAQEGVQPAAVVKFPSPVPEASRPKEEEPKKPRRITIGPSETVPESLEDAIEDFIDTLCGHDYKQMKERQQSGHP